MIYMGVYKDEKTGTWFVKCYYTDYTGARKQKMKRGFQLQRDAKDWSGISCSVRLHSPPCHLVPWPSYTWQTRGRTPS